MFEDDFLDSREEEECSLVSDWAGAEATIVTSFADAQLNSVEPFPPSTLV